MDVLLVFNKKIVFSMYTCIHDVFIIRADIIHAVRDIRDDGENHCMYATRS